MDEVTEVFQEEVREKKLAARGAVHRASRRRGLKGAIRTPYDLMGKEERKNYTRPSEVKTYFMLPSHEEYLKADMQERLRILDNALKHHSRQEILAAWGIDSKKLSYYLSYVKRANARKQQREVTGQVDTQVSPAPALPCFTLVVQGEFTGEELAGRLGGVSLVVGKDRRYQAQIAISELSG